MTRSAVAYRANGRLIIAPIVQTTIGLGVEVDPHCLPAPVDHDALANALAGALARSDRVVPHPLQGEWKGLFQPFLRAAGVRSYRAFMADAQRVGIALDGQQLTLEPQRNLGPREGFVPVPENAEWVDQDDLHQAAVILQRMLVG